MTRDKPTHKQCRQCGEWFTLKPRANRRQKFCTVSCSSKYRNAQPKWKKAQSRRMKAKTDPEVMRERAKALWRDPEMRARLSEQRRIQSNTKEHLASMVEHNKKLWKDDEFRKRHTERSSKQAIEQWRDPVYREKMTALTAEKNKQRWADSDYKERVSRKIRIAKALPLAKKQQSKTSRELAQRPEEKVRKSKQMKERWSDPEQRAQMSKNSSETAIRKWRDDPAYRKKHTAVLLANAPENSARMSKLNKKRWSNPKYVAQRKAWWTPERKAAQAEKNKKRWSDPKYKARVGKAISKARKARHAEAILSGDEPKP